MNSLRYMRYEYRLTAAAKPRPSKASGKALRPPNRACNLATRDVRGGASYVDRRGAAVRGVR
jgi:hypothetical protein